MENENHSWAWEVLKTLKVMIAIISGIAIIELGIIGYLGYLLYDSQFEYTEEQTQDVDNTTLENSKMVQY